MSDERTITVVPTALLDELQEAIYDLMNGGSFRAMKRAIAARSAMVSWRSSLAAGVQAGEKP